MINASEARKKSEDINNEANKVVFLKMQKAIEDAIRNGEFSTIVYVNKENESVEKEIKKLGYKIVYMQGYYDERAGMYDSNYRIDW